MTQHKLYFILIFLNLNILTFIIKNKDLGFLKKSFYVVLIFHIFINEMVPV